MMKAYALALTASLLISVTACDAAKKDAKLHDVAAGRTPRIAADETGNLHVVIQGLAQESGVANIFYTKSTDQGQTWSAPLDVSQSKGISSHPDIALEPGGAIDMVWRNGGYDKKISDVYFSRSTDSGKTWAEPVDVSSTPGVSTEPVLSVGSDSSIHIVWIDTTSGESHPDVYYASSHDTGKTWSKAEDISNTPGVSSEPTIAVEGPDAVHVAWLDTTPGVTHPDIYYAKKSQGAWTTAKDVSNTPRLSSHPGLACGPKGRVYLVWSDNSKKETAADVWCARAGETAGFAKLVNISSTAGVSSEAAIAADKNGRIAVVWSDTASGVQQPDIYTRVGIDNLDQISFAIDLTNTKGMSKHPHLSIAGNKMFVVWEEIVGESSLVKVTSMSLVGIPTGASFGVDRKRVNGKFVEF
jgi:BNR repeat-containing family member